MGGRDNCKTREVASRGGLTLLQVPYTAFAQWVLELCDREGVGSLIPFGALTGASAAFELAYLAAKSGRAAGLVQFESYYLSPKAKKYMDDVFIPSIRHLPRAIKGLEPLTHPRIHTPTHSLLVCP